MDRIVSLLCLIILMPFLVFMIVLITLKMKEFGLFTQVRIGMDSRRFKIYKLKSMKSDTGLVTNVTSGNDKRITPIGKFIRKYKIDELPQLFNVVKGDMSFVGPRPDVPGFADMLSEDDRVILTVRPGITGPAQLYFKNEEDILAAQFDAEKYNKEVIWPQKVELNKQYIENWTFTKDLYYIFKTLVS